jgi:hypothetical protein
MLGNINYPVRCTLAIELKNGNKFRFSCILHEAEKQLIERLYRLSTTSETVADPRQLSLQTPIRSPMTITTVGGKVIETKDGVSWEEVRGVPSPIKSVPSLRKTKADCGVYGFHCGTDKCPYPLYECDDRERGIIAARESTAARGEAVEKVKRKRGRPTKAESDTRAKAVDIAREEAARRAAESREIDACDHFPEHCASPTFCPRAETDCYRRSEGRRTFKREQELALAEKSPRHSGELCRGKVEECEFFCTSKNCVHWRQPLTYWSICNGENFPDGCMNCEHKDCFLAEPPINVVCKIKTAACDTCGNPYCSESSFRHPEPNSTPALVESQVVPVENASGSYCEGVSQACLDVSQDTGCKYYHGSPGCKYYHAIPMCKDGFPDKCSTSCRQERCTFYKWYVR